MVFRCPRCGRTRFHVEKIGSTYTLKCEKTKACDWQIDLTEES